MSEENPPEPASEQGSEQVSDEVVIDEAPKAKFGKQQIIATVVTLLVLVLVFFVVFPKFADYSQAWDAIQNMSVGSLVALIAVTIFLIIAYVWPYQAALPGLKYRPGFMVRQTSFMISNSIPAGGAFGIGVQYAMLHQQGFTPAVSTTAIGITSVWNTFVTLTFPVIAVVLLLITGQATGSAFLAAAAGVVIVGAMIGGFAWALSSESRARGLGELGNRIVRWGARLIKKDDFEPTLDSGLVNFRESTVDVIKDRWRLITGTNTLQQFLQFLILFIALIGIGSVGTDGVTFAEAFAAFALSRLATFIPVTPGGLGTVDAAMTALLVTAGASESDALAAVLVWRALTYFPQIFIGIGTF
ncbi:MAG: lysylphosphatidylglycerol synthase transmembrane domain-containing protein, partial [Microthrixaceae bacterium]